MMNPRRERRVACLAFATLAAAQASVGRAQPTAAHRTTMQEYAVDPGHSLIEFSIGFALGRVKGRFTQWRGTILYDSLNPASSSITVVIDAKSIDTGWPNRDRHLRTSDFFDVARYPTIVFQSQRLRQADSLWIAEGLLTMHGVTKPVAIPFRFRRGARARDAASRNVMLAVDGGLRLARADFGLVGGSTFNSWFTRARSATMSDSVDITLEVEGWRSDAASLRPPAIEAALERIRAGGIASHVRRIDSLRRTLGASEWASAYRGQELVVRALLQADDRRKAVALARALTEWFPGVPSAYAVRGLVSGIAGDSVGAARQYERAKQVFVAPVRDPNDPFAQDDENWWYLDHLVRSAIEWNFTSEAVPLAQLVAELYPDVARAHATLGLALSAAGDVRRAAAAFDRAQAVDRWDTRAMEWRRRVVVR